MNQKTKLHLVDDNPRKLFIADIQLVIRNLQYELIPYTSADAAFDFWQKKEDYDLSDPSNFFLFDALMPYSQKLEEKLGAKKEDQLTGCIFAEKLITDYQVTENQIAVISLYEAAKKETDKLGIRFFSKIVLDLHKIEEWLKKPNTMEANSL